MSEEQLSEKKQKVLAAYNLAVMLYNVSADEGPKAAQKLLAGLEKGKIQEAFLILKLMEVKGREAVSSEFSKYLNNKEEDA